MGYMFARLLKSFAIIFAAIVQSVSLGNSESVAEGVVAPEGVIHAVPITIILVKAYKILLEYAKTQHVNIKYVLEIAQHQLWKLFSTFQSIMICSSTLWED